MPIPGVELRLLDDYNKELDDLLNGLLGRGNELQDSKIYKAFDAKLIAYKKQIDLVKSLDSEDPRLMYHDSDYYYLLAQRTVQTAVLISFYSEPLNGPPANTGVEKLFEKAKSNKTLSIIDEGLRVYDNGHLRRFRSHIYVMLGRKEDAKSELRYIIANLADQEEAYVAARKDLDSLENPPKKGPCFVATACYGSYDHPDVLVLRQWRDNRLMRTNSGRSFVSWYYKVGPKLASKVERHIQLRNLIRETLVKPLVNYLRRNGV